MKKIRMQSIRPSDKVCVTCRAVYRPHCIGAVLLDYEGHDEVRSFWSVDVYRCPVCEHDIIHGIANNAVHHFDPQFQERLDERLEHARYNGRMVVEIHKPADLQ